MTPIKSIRKYCIWCCNGQSKEVALCNGTDCSLYHYRFSKKGEGAIKSSIKSIRLRCIDCMDGSPGEVKNCDETECTLHFFRMGKNPNIKLSEKRKEQLRKNMALIRKKRP